MWSYKELEIEITAGEQCSPLQTPNSKRGGVYMEVEIRSKNEAIVRGYVNVVERRSRPLTAFGRTFVEIVKQGVFSRAIKNARDENRAVEMLIDHNRTVKAADTLSGSLKLREDNIGLYAEAVIKSPEIIAEIREHRPKGWSFGFVKKKDKFTKQEGESIEERELEEIELKEVSLLIGKYPAYMATSVEVRGKNEVELEYRGYEDVNVVDCVKDEEKKSAEGYAKRVAILKLMYNA